MPAVRRETLYAAKPPPPTPNMVQTAAVEVSVDTTAAPAAVMVVLAVMALAIIGITTESKGRYTLDESMILGEAQIDNNKAQEEEESQRLTRFRRQYQELRGLQSEQRALPPPHPPNQFSVPASPAPSLCEARSDSPR